MNSPNILNICPACNNDQYTPSNLNKHLTACLLYDDFITSYIPPKGIICKYCNINFINKKYIESHACKCKDL